MAKTTLPTNYVDDVLNGAMDGKRRYREIPNADGTISLEDATTYDQIGNNFGASQVNLMNDNINQSFDANKMLKTMDEVNAVEQEGYGVDALVVKQLSNSLVSNIYVGDDGKLHKVQGGADSVLPFNSFPIGIGTDVYVDLTGSNTISAYKCKVCYVSPTQICLIGQISLGNDNWTAQNNKTWSASTTINGKNYVVNNVKIPTHEQLYKYCCGWKLDFNYWTSTKNPSGYSYRADAVGVMYESQITYSLGTTLFITIEL